MILDQNGKPQRVNASDLEIYLAKEGYRLAESEGEDIIETSDELEAEEAEGEKVTDEEESDSDSEVIEPAE